jgi:hypothetical protein
MDAAAMNAGAATLLQSQPYAAALPGGGAFAAPGELLGSGAAANGDVADASSASIHPVTGEAGAAPANEQAGEAPGGDAAPAGEDSSRVVDRDTASKELVASEALAADAGAAGEAGGNLTDRDAAGTGAMGTGAGAASDTGAAGEVAADASPIAVVLAGQGHANEGRTGIAAMAAPGLGGTAVPPMEGSSESLAPAGLAAAAAAAAAEPEVIKGGSAVDALAGMHHLIVVNSVVNSECKVSCQLKMQAGCMSVDT